MTEQPDPPPLPERPYRKSLVVNFLLAAALFAFAWVVSGRWQDAIIYGTFYFVFATGWSWWRVRKRLATEPE